MIGQLKNLIPLKKGDLMEALKLGAGSVAAITLTDLLMSRVLVKDGAPVIPQRWAPLVIAGMSLVGGQMVSKKFDRDIGLGMIAGGVGVAVSALVGKMISPAVEATTAAAASTEAAGAPAQQTGGFGFGRAYAPGLGGFAGLGRLAARNPGSAVYGIGTPDMSANRMFNGATVSIEEANGAMAGATVEYEDSNAFAGALA